MHSYQLNHGQRGPVSVRDVADDVNRDMQERRDAYGLNRAPAVDLQTLLNKAYLSGNGAEVERVLAMIAETDFALPPKGHHRAA